MISHDLPLIMARDTGQLGGEGTMCPFSPRRGGIDDGNDDDDDDHHTSYLRSGNRRLNKICDDDDKCKRVHTKDQNVLIPLLVISNCAYVCACVENQA